jgi:hypothetical protein
MRNQRVLLALLSCLSLTAVGAASAAPGKSAVRVSTTGGFKQASLRSAGSGSNNKKLVAGLFKKKPVEKSTDKDDEKEKSQVAAPSETSKGDDESKSAESDKPAADQKKEKAAAPAAAPATAPVVEASSAAAAPAQADEPPPLVPDSALISVLKDLSRALMESEEIEKIEDGCQKTAADTARLALAKALSNAQLSSNRIVTMKERPKFESSMTAEAWDSGEITLSPKCHASLNAVWAKKLDGLLNVSIAGNCGCSAAPNGSKLGEFVFVASGKSTMDKGFDIQSQSDVNFWLGKLNGFTVDGTCCVPAEAAGEAQKTSSQNSTLVLKAVLTEKGIEHLALTKQFKEQQRQLALKAEEERKLSEQKAKDEADQLAKAEAEDKVKAEAEAEAKERSEAEAKEKGKSDKEKVAKQPEGSEKAPAAAAAAATESAASKPGSSNPPEPSSMPSPAVVEDPRSHKLGDLAMTSVSPAPALPPAVSSTRGWDSPAPSPATRVPSSSAQVLLPEKAVAGQFLTAAVMNPNHAGEPLVELSFNGATLATSQDGKALYMVPDDAIPGPTLQVGLAARPEQQAATVQILQPLAVPTGPQIPRVDRVSQLAESGGEIVIDGHSFDGVADRNRVIVDGTYDAHVLVASPVQLKADLPGNLIPGSHSVSVSTAGLRSNPGQFEVVALEIRPFGKETAKDDINRLAVRVLGTSQIVRVHVKNFTPEVLKIGRGDELVLNSPGGTNNQIVLAVQRLRKGSYHVDAKLE